MKKIKLTKLLKHILEDVDLTVNENDLVSVKADNKLIPVESNGSNLIIPSKDNIKNNLIRDGVIVALPFNPLNEQTLLKGLSASYNIIKRAISTRLTYGTYIIGRCLIDINLNNIRYKDVPTILSKFTENLNNVKIKNVAKMIDDTTIKQWDAIYNSVDVKPNTFVNITPNKNTEIKGVKFNRITVFSSPLYDRLVKLSTDKDNKDTTINDVKLRHKDIIVFKTIIEFIYPDIANTMRTIAVGSDDKLCPAFISCMKLYNKLSSNVNSIMKNLSYVEEDLVESYNLVDSYVTDEVLDNLDLYQEDLALIPSDVDIKRMGLEEDTAVIPTSKPLTNKVNNIAKAVGQDKNREKSMSEMSANALKMAMYGVPASTPAPATQPSVPPMMYNQPVQQNVQYQQPVPPVQPAYPVDQFGRPLVDQFGRPLAPQQQPVAPAMPQQQAVGVNEYGQPIDSRGNPILSDTYNNLVPTINNAFANTNPYGNCNVYNNNNNGQPMIRSLTGNRNYQPQAVDQFGRPIYPSMQSFQQPTMAGQHGIKYTPDVVHPVYNVANQNSQLNTSPKYPKGMVGKRY